MIETLNQNLEILTAETSSDAGFIIKLSSSGFEIIAAFNEQNFDIIPLGNDLRRLHLGNILNNEKIAETDSYLYLALEKDIKTFFFEKITDINSQESVYLLLFSGLKQNYSKQKTTVIRKYINEANKQIKALDKIKTGGGGQEEDTSVYNILRGEWFSQNHELFLSTLLNSFNDLLFVLDENGYIIAVSKSGAQSLDFSELDMRGKHLLEFVKFEEKVQLMEELKKTVVTERKLSLDVTFIGKYENEIPFHLSCSLIKTG